MRLRKKLVLSMLVVGMGMVLSGCSGTNGSKVTKYDTSKNNEVISKAIDKLGKMNETYLVDNSVVANGSTSAYIEVNTKGGESYTEYPVDKNGKSVDISSVKDTSNLQYTLSDWITKGGKYYVLGTDSSTGKSVFQELPLSYSKVVSDRKVMYLNLLKDKFTSIKKKEDTKQTLGSEEVTLKMYECKVDSDVITKYLGIQSRPIYDCIKKEYKDDKNITNLCDYYLDDYNMSLTFSDANVTIGIADGVVRYLSVEVGGLGSKMYLTRVVLKKTGVEERETPDFSKAVNYVDNQIKEVADFCASYDTVEEGINAFYNNSSTSTGNNSSATSKPSKNK